MSTFGLLKFLTQLVMPPGLLGCGVLGWLVLRLAGWRRLARVVLAAGIAPSLILSLQPVSGSLMRSLEDEARADAARAPACCYDFIVVLGAGVITAAPPQRLNPELTDTSDRLWHAARLFRNGVAPRIVVTGGTLGAGYGRPAQSEAEAMRAVLVDLGVPDDRIILENRALNTIENMREVRRVVGNGRVALVTSAFHMPRALRLAHKAGLQVEAFPTDWRVVSTGLAPWDIYLPSMDALWNGSIALREYLALLFDRRGADLAP